MATQMTAVIQKALVRKARMCFPSLTLRKANLILVASISGLLPSRRGRVRLPLPSRCHINHLSKKLQYGSEGKLAVPLPCAMGPEFQMRSSNLLNCYAGNGMIL
ncbi:hypothetical protein SDJN02_21104, partial [Cucurbita argyrosperma subsp. argyrosperma]